jgi:hypothetical protein
MTILMSFKSGLGALQLHNIKLPIFSYSPGCRSGKVKEDNFEVSGIIFENIFEISGTMPKVEFCQRQHQSSGISAPDSTN